MLGFVSKLPTPALVAIVSGAVIIPIVMAGMLLGGGPDSPSLSIEESEASRHPPAKLFGSPTQEPISPATRLPPTPHPPTVTPGPLSPQAVKLLHHYHMLLSFKDNPDFHVYCYGVGGPYNAWAESGEAIGTDAYTFLETGIHFQDLRRMGWEYCQNGGRETEETRYTHSLMEPRWLAEMPPLPPRPTPTTDQLIVKICTDFLETVAIARSLGFDDGQIVVLFMEEGMAEEKIGALAADCPAVVGQ